MQVVDAAIVGGGGATAVGRASIHTVEINHNTVVRVGEFVQVGQMRA